MRIISILLLLFLGCSTQKNFVISIEDNNVYKNAFLEVSSYLNDSTSLESPIILPKLENEFYSILFSSKLYEEGLSKQDLRKLDLDLIPSFDDQIKFESYLTKKDIVPGSVVIFTNIADNRFFAEAFKYNKNSPYTASHSDTSYFFYFRINGNEIIETTNKRIVNDF